MPIKLNNGALKSVVDVKLNNGSLRTVTGIWYNNGGTLERVYPEFYTSTVYDGSHFYDFMKSGVNNRGYMNTQYASKNTFARTNLGLPAGYTNIDFGPSSITSGSLWMDHADEGGRGYDGGYGEFVSRDQINFSKFKSITISGTHFMSFYCNDPVALTYDPYISIFQSDSNTSDSQYGNRITQDIYTNPPTSIIRSDDGGGDSWSGSFSLTFNISSWTSTNKYLSVYLRTSWNECLVYGDGGRGGITITKIVFNV